MIVLIIKIAQFDVRRMIYISNLIYKIGSFNFLQDVVKTYMLLSKFLNIVENVLENHR